MLDSWSLQEDKHKSHEWGHLWNLVTIREGAEQATNLHISDLTCWLKGEMKLVYLLKIPISLQDLAPWRTYVDVCLWLSAKICTGKQSRKPWTSDFNQIKNQLLDLSEQELEQVTRFMGHDIKVHCDFYRPTDKTFQIATISEFLFAMEEGMSALTGKNLDTTDLSVCGKCTVTDLFLLVH